jgi:protein TonB
MIGVFTAQPALPPPPPPAARAAVQPQHQTTASVPSDVAPTEAPDTIGKEPPTTTSVTGDPNGIAGGLPDGLIGGHGRVPEVPPTPAPVPPRPVPVGGRIKEPAKIHHVPPMYPVIAQQSKVQGVVILEAVISEDGAVESLRVLRSQPLLDAAALEAVRQWRFTPTLLNGQPVPVVMTVTVNFSLD